MEEMRETRTKFLWLMGIYLYNVKQQYAKKFILECPPDLASCSLNFRETTNHKVGKYAMFIILKLRQTNPVTDPVHVTHPSPLGERADLPITDLSKQPIMNLIACNCRGL